MVSILFNSVWGSMKPSSSMLKSLVSGKESFGCLSSNDDVFSGRGNTSVGDNTSLLIISDEIMLDDSANSGLAVLVVACSLLTIENKEWLIKLLYIRSYCH